MQLILTIYLLVNSYTRLGHNAKREFLEIVGAGSFTDTCHSGHQNGIKTMKYNSGDAENCRP